MRILGFTLWDLFAISLVVFFLARKVSKRRSPKRKEVVAIKKEPPLRNPYNWEIMQQNDAMKRWWSDIVKQETEARRLRPKSFEWVSKEEVEIDFFYGEKKKGKPIFGYRQGTCDRTYKSFLDGLVVTGIQTKDGVILSKRKKEIPKNAHIETFVGALSQPNMATELESIKLRLAEKGKTVCDITEINGITEERYMSEYFRDDMRTAWGDALVRVLKGAAERFTVDSEKPFLITLFAPKEPI